MEGVGAHHARNQEVADIGAAQRRNHEKGDREDRDGCLDPHLAEGPTGIRRMGQTARSPALLERDEVEPKQHRSRGGQPDQGEDDQAGTGVVDDLHREDGAGRQQRHQPVSPVEGPPADPQAGADEHHLQADHHQQVGLTGKVKQPLADRRQAAPAGERRRGQQRQADDQHQDRCQQVAEAGKSGGRQQPPEHGRQRHGRYQSTGRIRDPGGMLDRRRHRPPHQESQQQEQPGVAELEGNQLPAGPEEAQAQPAVLVMGPPEAGRPGAAGGDHQQEDDGAEVKLRQAAAPSQVPGRRVRAPSTSSPPAASVRRRPAMAGSHRSHAGRDR